MKLSFFHILVFICAFASALAYGRDFVMDCGVREAFVGQKILCHFILYADEDIVEVEVVKFPEFRGYWSENLAMRQGPIGLTPIPTPKGVRKLAIIGSYYVSQMVNKTEAQIIPMKITVKSRSFRNDWDSPPGQGSEILASEPLALTFVPLPPLPKSFSDTYFSGLVGEFEPTQNQMNVEYRLNEPTSFKISIEGKGNFPELNSLPLLLPQDAEIISHRTFLQNLGDTMVKTFEYSILLKSLAPTVQHLGSFLFFNPKSKLYEKIQLPEAKFILAPALLRDESPQFKLPNPERQWNKATHPLTEKPFLISQLFLFLMTLGFVLKNYLAQRALAKVNSSEFQREQKWATALVAQKEGNHQKAIQVATSIFTQLLKEKTGKLNIRLETYPTQKRLLKKSHKLLPDNRLKIIEELFNAYDQTFSPHGSSAKPQINLDELKSALNDSNN